MAENGSWIQKLFTSRDRNTLKFDQTFGNIGNTFVGEVGRLWYNPDTNCLYVSDGNTPGGIPLNTCGSVLGTANIAVYDEGNLIANRTASFDFVGAGVTATAVGNAITITVPGVDTAYPLTVQDEGNTLTTAANVMNFTGEGVTANATGNSVTVSVGPGIAYLYSGSFLFDTATTLTAGINSNTTDPIPVVSTAGFYTSGYIRIGTELIQYTGKTATTFTGITRGVAGSNGSTHGSGSGVSQAQVTAAGVPSQVLLDVTDISNNVTLDPSTGNVTVAGAGTYNLMFSAQIENFSNNPADTAIWFRVNGNDVPTSASYATTAAIHGGVPGASIVAVNIFYTLVAGDVVALMWTSLNGETAITSVPPVAGSIPQSPGMIFTVNRIY